jgi:hypothetical protein
MVLKGKATEVFGCLLDDELLTYYTYIHKALYQDMRASRGG